MEFIGITLRVSVTALILMSALIVAQDEDEQNLIAIEQAFCGSEQESVRHPG